MLNFNIMGEKFKGKDDLIKEIYDDIKLPTRATIHSAGYDFFAPYSFGIPTKDGVVIPTGIRCKIRAGWVLKLYPRSGHGNRHGVHLYDTVAVIDGDYYDTSNEGHILIKLTAKDHNCSIEKGIGMCQGVFIPYGITIDDDVTETRTGGFGSTSKK